jgi:methylated-DNA-[protein]-cysteine S-methyltransferase
VAFESHGDFDALRAHAGSRRGSQAARRHVTDAGDKLRDYLAGAAEPVDCVVDWASLASSGADALKSTQSIPYAGQRSYTNLTHIGSAQDLGRVMGANPIPIVAPCHRVTRGVEIPTTFVGGADRRHWLKDHESAAAEA